MLKKSLLLIGLMISMNLKADEGFASYIGTKIPTEPSNPKITKLIKELGADTIIDNKKIVDNKKLKTYRELGVLFWDIENYEAAEYYLSMSRNYVEPVKVVEQPKETPLSNEDLKSIEKDQKILEAIPQSFTNVSKENMQKVAKMIDDKILWYHKNPENIHNFLPKNSSLAFQEWQRIITNI